MLKQNQTRMRTQAVVDRHASAWHPTLSVANGAAHYGRDHTYPFL